MYCLSQQPICQAYCGHNAFQVTRMKQLTTLSHIASRKFEFDSENKMPCGQVILPPGQSTLHLFGLPSNISLH